MDIDDILREALPSASAGDDAAHDLKALTRAWVSERSCPELLPWPADGLIERINARVRAQIERVEEMTGDMDPKTNFGLIVIQTELERWKYLVRSYLRARIAKIDQYTLHYLTLPEAQVAALLSPAELAYATRHQALLHQHYLASFLGSFPANLQNLNDTQGGMSMIDAPDAERAVFVRVLRACVVRASGREADTSVDGVPGDVLIVRWADVKGLMEDGDVELV